MTTVQDMINYLRWNSNIKFIALEGGPCGGKSTFLKMARKQLETCGVKVFVVPEMARELISSGFVPWDTAWKGSQLFQRHLFLASLEKMVRYVQAVQGMNLGNQQVVFFCDRGLPGGAAYCGDEAFQNMLIDFGISLTSILDIYHAVIHLVTAADGAPQYYVTDDERHELIEEACALDQRTFAAWQLHQHISRIDNSTDFPTKISRALLALRRTLTLNMQQPQEIEKKFQLLNFSHDQLPPDATSYEIVQIYLDRIDKPGIECRVRKKITKDGTSYYYTEKIDTEERGVRTESEESISEKHFHELVTLYADPNCRAIEKTRYKFGRGKDVFEIDVYKGYVRGLVMMEVEVSTVEDLQTVTVPAEFTATDVTGNVWYSNRSLAQHGIPVAK